MNFSEKVYSIPPQSNYLRNLAEFIIQKTSGDVFLLANSKVFLPNRRSVNALKQEFFNINKNSGCILPQIFAIGDIDENEFDTSFIADEITSKKVISKTERKLLLTNLIFEKKELLKTETKKLNLDHAASLANSLLDFFDEIQKNELSFDNLQNIVPQEKDLTEYWTKSLTFLKIVTEEYPKIIASRNLEDPIIHRNNLINEYIKILSEKNSDDFIFIAGTTGSQKSTTRFIKAVLGLKNSYFILPYIDEAQAEKSWQSLAKKENHLNHQHLIYELLNNLKIQREDIKKISFNNISNLGYDSFISEVAKPANEVINWKNFDISKLQEAKQTERIKLVEAENLIEEAKIIALILRQAAHENKTAIVVTSNNMLVQYVQNFCKKYNINIDYSGGKKLLKTPVAKFFLQIAKLVQGQFRTVDLLSILKNPLLEITEGSQNSQSLKTINLKNFIARLEINVIRKNRLKYCFQLSDFEFDNKKFSEAEITFIKSFLNKFFPLTTIFNRQRVTISALLLEHIKIAESLNKNLFTLEAGEELSMLLQEAISCKQLENFYDHLGYTELLENLFADEVYRKKFGFDDKFVILTPIEARLQQADVKIIADLNEGKWPKINENPWLSEKMKDDFGLPSIAHSIALSAHDFVSALHAENIYLTRSKKSRESLNTASPFLDRLKTFYKIKNIEQALTPAINYHEIIKDFDSENILASPYLPPIPIPPVEARPQKLSVTKIEKLIKNPYAIYAAEVLKLRAIDELEDDESKSLFGTILHAALEDFVNLHQLDESKINFDNLYKIGLEKFLPYKNSDAYKIWLTKFEQIAIWFADKEKQSTMLISKIFVEQKEQMQLKVKDYIFTLNAKADRIELHKNNQINVVDYKTGSTATKGEISRLLKPQLLLEVLILKNLLENKNISEYKISYYKFAGAKNNFAYEKPEVDVEKTVELLEQELKNLIADLFDASKPFLSNPHNESNMKDVFDDYQHLARTKEWK